MQFQKLFSSPIQHYVSTLFAVGGGRFELKTVKSLSLKNIFIGAFGLALLLHAYRQPIPCCSSQHFASFLIVNPQGERFQGYFVSIQQAINEAEDGSTIQVPSGTYYEHVVVNKTVSLIGENVSTTIIDGTYNGTVVQIVADSVSINGFTARNSGCTWEHSGISAYGGSNCEIRNNILINNCHNIKLDYSHNCTVVENTIDGECYGIRFMNSDNCTAIDNYVSNCIGGIHLENATDCTVRQNQVTKNGQGIRMYSPCTYNSFIENLVYNNSYDGMIVVMPTNSTFFGNRIFHNSFVNNASPFVYDTSGNIWDDDYPSGGNYWSRYNGTDLFSGLNQNRTGDDGIGDTPYTISSHTTDKDRYPLMHPYGSIINLETNLTYLTISSAIDAPETLEEDTIRVRSGTYKEHITLNKTLTLLGENQTTTIIDGENAGTVVHVTASQATVSGFTVRNSGLNSPPYGMDCGVLLNHTTGCNISNIIATSSRIGVYLFFSEANAIEHNVISSNFENGVWLWYSSNNTLRDNQISNNLYNFGVFGSSFPDFDNSVDVSNTVDGKPVRYMVGAEDEIFDNQTDIGTLYLVNCKNVTVCDLNLTKNGHGVFFYNVSNSSVHNVTASQSNYGIYLQDSNNNTIDNSNCSDNWVGICLQNSNHNIVKNNAATSCEKGISLYEASNNSLEGNTALNNLYGIRLFSSSLNEVFHNNLVENTEHVGLVNSYQNTWDNGFEGNFWSNYTGSDANQDGLGETPQFIDNDNLDNYPLMGTYHSFNVCQNESFYDVAVVSNSTILGLTFENTNSTIRITVNGTDGTYGFCRIRIPHALMNSELTVMIDDGRTEVLCPNYDLRNDSSSTWIYFAYQHSTHEIIVVPEFPSAALLFTLVATALWCWLIKN